MAKKTEPDRDASIFDDYADQEAPKADPPKVPPLNNPSQDGPKPQESKPQEVKRTPAEWAALKQDIKPRNPKMPQSVDAPSAIYAAADSLYGWSQDAHHNQGSKAFVLIEVDYTKALEAAGAYPCAAPHPAALPASRKDAFKDFIPSKRREKSARKKGAR